MLDQIKPYRYCETQIQNNIIANTTILRFQFLSSRVTTKKQNAINDNTPNQKQAKA